LPLNKEKHREPTTKQPHRTAASCRIEADPDEIAALFSLDVQFEIAGDIGALPWIGRRTGRSAVSDFIRETRRLIEQIRFDVQDILASDDRQ
jgi:ketosteroid isomerase-like protein